MFGLALSLWIIDLHVVIVEVQNTLLSAAIGPLEDLYPLALSKVQAMAAVEDVLYAYMVSPPIYMIAESYRLTCPSYRQSSVTVSSYGASTRSGQGEV